MAHIMRIYNPRRLAFITACFEMILFTQSNEALPTLHVPPGMTSASSAHLHHGNAATGHGDIQRHARFGPKHKACTQ